MRAVTGVLLHPRLTMDEVAGHPTFLIAWLGILLTVAVCGGILLPTQVGQQALVDERVRVTEALGQRVDDAEYARLEAHPPVLVYLTSGGRVLLMPPITLLVAAALVLLARIDGASVKFVTALSITVHATVVLAVQQIIATPVHYAYESLTSPTSIAGLLRVFDEGTWAARLFGTVDVFGLWWMWLLSIGLAAAAGKKVRHYIWRLVLVYVGIAAIVTAVFAVMGSGN